VWNGLTDYDHPTQVLADLMTIKANFQKPLNQIKMVYCGDARNNMGNALLIGSAKMGMHFVSLAPKELWPEQELINRMQKVAEQTGAVLDFFDIKNKAEALADADVIYTDVWVSMGEEDKFEERIKLLTPYRVTMEFIELTNNEQTIFLHCLPAFHNIETGIGAEINKKFGIKEMEVTNEVFKSRYSRVFDQAENRMHTIKAIMVATIG
jgi:ornithine carbamoyltransferase